MSSTASINTAEAIDRRMPVTRKAAPHSTDDTSPSRRAKISKRLCTYQNNGHAETLPTGGVEFGNFQGDTIYRNRISPGEKREDAHYSIEDLVLPQTTMVLCTTFEGGSSSVKWYQGIFRGIPELLVVTSAEKDTPHTIGAAVLEPMTPRKENEIPGWYWLKCRPHTGGCLHSKVLLLRSRKGLRVVVSGNNLTRSQWEGHRDIFWAKDFKLASYNKGKPENGEFGYDLCNVLTWMTKCACRKDQKLVQPRIDAIFVGIDFSSKARLVISFPRPKGSKDERGGWKKLVRVVDRVLRASDLRKDDPDSDDNDWKTDAYDQQQSSTLNNYESVLYATSGSFGNLEPDFLLQMYEAMDGKERRASKGTEWERIHDDVRCFWPGKATACTMDLIGVVGALRPMPQSHWDTIPDCSKVKVFHDAIPNPPTKIPSKLMGSSGQEFHPVTHGKFIWNSRGVLYVGSHNLSKAAWGLRNAQPKNVEIGVVLATRDADKRAEWISRFPCQLVKPDKEAPVTYSPYTRYRDIENDHPEAQNRVCRQAILLYELAELVWPPNHSFFAVPLETLLGRSTESVKAFVQEFQPKIHEAMEQQTRVANGLKDESSDSEDEAYRYDD